MYVCSISTFPCNYFYSVDDTSTMTIATTTTTTTTNICLAKIFVKNQIVCMQFCFFSQTFLSICLFLCFFH